MRARRVSGSAERATRVPSGATRYRPGGRVQGIVLDYGGQLGVGVVVLARGVERVYRDKLAEQGAVRVRAYGDDVHARGGERGGHAVQTRVGYARGGRGGAPETENHITPGVCLKRGGGTVAGEGESGSWQANPGLRADVAVSRREEYQRGESGNQRPFLHFLSFWGPMEGGYMRLASEPYPQRSKSPCMARGRHRGGVAGA